MNFCFSSQTHLRCKRVFCPCLAVGGFALVCLFLPAGEALAATPAELIGPDLSVQRVSVTSLRDEVLHYFDAQRNLQSSGIGQWVQLRSIGGEALIEVISGERLWLTDGQCFSGRWVGPTPDGNKLQWEHPLLGLIEVPLEDVAQVYWSLEEQGTINAPIDTPVSDTLVMINGDVLTGFVSALVEEGVALIISEAGQQVTIPYDRIRSMSLANPPRRVLEPYDMVTLTDGTRAWADQVTITGERASWRFIPPGSSAGEVEVPIEELSRIDFLSRGLKLIDLTGLPLRTVQEADVFGLAIPMRVDGQSIHMHAPIEIAFDLPEGAGRFAASAELDTSDPAAGMDDWPDFHLVVLCEGEQVTSGYLSGSNPAIRINTAVSGSTLTIRLEAGLNGPILDRLLLRDAVILIRSPESAPSEAPGPPGR